MLMYKLTHNFNYFVWIYQNVRIVKKKKVHLEKIFIVEINQLLY